MTAIEHHGRATLDAYLPCDLPQAFHLCEVLVAAQAIPSKTAGAALSVAIAGARFDLDIISAHRAFFVDRTGKVGVYADGLRGLVEASGLCERFDLVEDPSLNDLARAVFECQRTGRALVRVGFTQDDAKRAKLWGKSGPWKDYPDRMLVARAAAKAARLVWPDVCGGMYTRDELSSGAHDDPQPIASVRIIDEDVVEGVIVEDPPADEKPRRPPPMPEVKYLAALRDMGLGAELVDEWRTLEKGGPVVDFGRAGMLEKLRDEGTGRMDAVGTLAIVRFAEACDSVDLSIVDVEAFANAQDDAITTTAGRYGMALWLSSNGNAKVIARWLEQRDGAPS